MKNISILAVISVLALSAIAAPGDLDTSFHSDGIMTDTFPGPRPSYGYDTAIQPDGKIVVAGYILVGDFAHFAVARYHADGSPDTTFDGDGRATTTVGVFAAAFSVAIQTDGKIVLAGETFNGSQRDFALVRFNANGSLDTSFDGDGKLITALGPADDTAYAVAIQADGQLVVAGRTIQAGSGRIAVVRYNTNGSIDTSFDGDGIVITTVGSSNVAASSAALQADGKIVVAGGTGDPTLGLFVFRYNADGSQDTTFDGDGVATTAIGPSFAAASSVVIQTDGKIVAAGTTRTGSENDFALVRYNTNGSLDTSFDTDGIVTTTFAPGSNEECASVAIQSDGKIIAAGYSFPAGAPHTDFAVVRYDADGSLDDLLYGSGGKKTVDIGVGTHDTAFGLALDSTGRAILSGVSHSPNFSTTQFAVVRLLADALPPTAAEVSVAGRVTNSDGRGIGKVRVSLTDSSGNTSSVTTSTFGYYKFDEVASGETYLISANHKRHSFSPASHIIRVTDELTDINFTVEE